MRCLQYFSFILRKFEGERLTVYILQKQITSFFCRDLLRNGIYGNSTIKLKLSVSNCHFDLQNAYSTLECSITALFSAA